MSIEPEVLEVAGLTIDVVRKDIKNMHLAVYPPTGRVRLAVPTATKDERLRMFAITKLPWIKKHVEEMQSRPIENPKEYVYRESHYLFGRRYLLKLIPSRKSKVELTKRYMKLFVPESATVEKKRNVVNEFYREQLKLAIPELLAKAESRLGVKCNRWSIRSMKTKWGSCNPDAGHILLNLELAKKPFECLEYVVIHELLHLTHKTHNRQFFEALSHHLPNWTYQKRKLNSNEN